MEMNDEYVRDHAYQGEYRSGASCQFEYGEVADGYGNTVKEGAICGQQAMVHANPGNSSKGHLIQQYPHPYVSGPADGGCAFVITIGEEGKRCGYPEAAHSGLRREVVRVADVQQYARAPMPEAARRGIQVTLLDGPFDPLGTLACISGIYKGEVYRAKSEVTDEQRRAAWEAMQKTVLSGPLEAMQFTFLIEGLDRAMTHQLVRNRFGFYAQESLRFAVAEDWAQEIPLPPSLAGLADDDPRVLMWLRGLNAAEDSYAALVAGGMPAEEARGLLPHAITTRVYVTWSLRTILMEAGKRTCTQAQFPWRVLFAQMAKAFRARAQEGENMRQPDGTLLFEPFLDNWQYELFASALRPVCYQTGRCGFKAEFDRACSIRERVDANERIGRPSSEWGKEADLGLPNPWNSPGVPWSKFVRENCHRHYSEVAGEPAHSHDVIPAIHDSEWAADPAAARVAENTPTTKCRKPHPTTDGCYECCELCNYDRHTCHGCGESLKHDGKNHDGTKHEECT